MSKQTRFVRWALPGLLEARRVVEPRHPGEELGGPCPQLALLPLFRSGPLAVKREDGDDLVSSPTADFARTPGDLAVVLGPVEALEALGG